MEESNPSEIKILEESPGTGVAVVKGALVICNFTGYLEDGVKFDSSYDHGRPFECVVGSKKVIAGWSQGLMGMKEGGRRKFFVPAALAYGERQIGAFIKPYSNLIYEVEVIEVRPREG